MVSLGSLYLLTVRQAGPEKMYASCRVLSFGATSSSFWVRSLNNLHCSQKLQRLKLFVGMS